MPIIVLFVFGSIETTDAIFLKQILKTASYEGARAATEPQATTAKATTAAQAVLTARSIANATITVSPGVTTATASGTAVTVTVSATAGSNSALSRNFAGIFGLTLSASSTMIHE